MAQEIHLNQLFQNGATNGQVIKWNNSTQLWEPANSTDLNGIYSGSGIIGSPFTNAQLALNGEFVLSFNGSLVGGIDINDLGKLMTLSSNNGQFKTSFSDTGLILTGKATGGVLDQSISFSNTAMTITDNKVAPHGILYAANYTAGFLPRSLVDKAYVDAIVAAGGADGNGIYTGSGTIPNATAATATNQFFLKYSTGENALSLYSAATSISLFSKNGSGLMSVDNIQSGLLFGSNSFIIDSTGSWFNHGVAIGFAGLETSAALEIDSINKALLISRMSTSQRNALTPVDGMLVYNNTSNTFNIRQNGAWLDLSTGGADGNGIYSGSGNVPNATFATVNGTFYFLYAGDGNAIIINSVIGSVHLEDNGGVAILDLSNDGADLGYITTSLHMDGAGTLFTNPVTIGAAGFESSGGFELDSTVKAVILSRMTSTQRNALTGIDGMILYDATLGQYFGRQGGVWNAFTTGAVPMGGIGDVLQGGNSFGTLMTLGTNDNNALNLRTNGVPRLTISSAAAGGGNLISAIITSNTNTVGAFYTLGVNSTGTTATGFGSRILFNLKLGVTTDQNAIGLDATWSNVGSTTSRFIINGINGGSLSEMLRVNANTAPELVIASAMGTAGNTLFKNAGITTGTAFTLGGSGNTLTIQGSSGLIDINTSANSTTAILINATNDGGSVVIGNTSYSNITLSKKNIKITDSYTVASGSGTYTGLAFNTTFNLTSTAGGAQIGFDIDPTLTSLGGTSTFRGLNAPYSNANAYFIYQSGALTRSYFNGPLVLGTTTQATGARVTVVGNQQTTGQYHSLAFTLSDGGTIPVDWNNGNVQYVTLGGNRTITVSNPREGGRYLLGIIQDGTGSRTLTWPTIKWAGGSAPVLTATANRTDIISLVYLNGSYHGTIVLNFF